MGTPFLREETWAIELTPWAMTIYEIAMTFYDLRPDDSA
jgi:hypothetical protein